MGRSTSVQDRLSDRVAVIQRHAHERTQEVGLLLAEREFPGAAVRAVAAGDFPATLRRCFEEAVALDREWTVTLDGDVLLLPGSGDAILHIGRKLPKQAGHAWFLVQDLVTTEVRPAGVRLYRTATMAAALERGDWCGRLRPETELLDSLPDIQHRAPGLLVGLHDYEQYYRDLLRTAFVMIRKKSSQSERLLALWQLRAADPDFAALLAGGRAAQSAHLALSFDAQAYRPLVDEFLTSSGLEEKGPLARVPEKVELESRIPASALRLQHPGFAARHLPRVWRKAGNGVHGLPLLRYAAERTFATLLRR